MAKITVKCTERTLFEGVRKQLRDVPSPCGGRGSCGTCRVKVVSGKPS